MEEMVAPFLPFFIFVSYLCKSIEWQTGPPNCASPPQVEPFKSRRYDKKCKNTAHIERSLLNNSYLCNIVQ